MPPASMAAAVPEPMAMPRSACASAGASLMPSPTMATRRPPADRKGTRLPYTTLFRSDAAGFHGGGRAGTYCDAEIGLRQRGRVVDAVAHHGDAAAASRSEGHPSALHDALPI